MKNDLIEGQEVFIVVEEYDEEDMEFHHLILKGIISDEKPFDGTFKNNPLENMVYIPVKWEDGSFGSPLYSSLSNSKKEAIQKWSNDQIAKINQIIYELETNDE